MTRKNPPNLAIVPSEKAPEVALQPVIKTGYEAAPKHFRKKIQREAWADLTEKAGADKLTAENYFTFEVCATLVAKFREGRGLNATEHKEMKKLLIALGLAKPDDDGQKKKPKKNDHYFE